MFRTILIILAVLLGIGLIASFVVTRDGQRVTPKGAGEVSIDGKTFEAFPLPDYAAAVLTDDYKSYFIEVEPGIKIHVLETGSGYPVYMQHGNPTSGFLYRKVADALPKDRVRLIMPTLPGLGFSSKIPASEHTLDNHMRWMNAALEALELDGVIYVGQDWGGPVGMGALALSPDLLEGVVAMNTGLNAPTEKVDLSRAHATVKTPVVGEMLTEVFGSVFDALPDVQGDPDSLPDAVIALYAQPVRESGNAKAPLALMRMVSDGPDHPSSTQMRQIEAYVQTLDIPAEIVWGLQDPILGARIDGMKRNFPNARVTETQAGHFLQEEVPAEIAAAVMRLVEQVDPVAAPDASNTE
ncbi:MAG: alpha/beta fold hydrolase [Pseudomonadota bacterium]